MIKKLATPILALAMALSSTFSYSDDQLPETSMIILGKNMISSDTWSHVISTETDQLIHSKFDSYSGKQRVSITTYKHDYADFIAVLRKLESSDKRLGLKTLVAENLSEDNRRIYRIDFEDAVKNIIYSNYLIEAKTGRLHHVLFTTVYDAYTPNGWDEAIHNFNDYGDSLSLNALLSLPADFEIKTDIESKDDPDYKKGYERYVIQLNKDSIGLLTNVIDVDWVPLQMSSKHAETFNLSLSDGRYGTSVPKTFYHKRLGGQLMVMHHPSQMYCSISTLPYNQPQAIKNNWEVLSDIKIPLHDLHKENWDARLTILDNGFSKKYITEICDKNTETHQSGGAAVVELTVPKSFEFFMNEKLFVAFINGLHFDSKIDQEAP